MAQTVTPLEARTLTDSVVGLSGLRLLLLIAIWFGIFAGLIEGCGLILFQRLNWQNWGQVLHVSAPIIWISPLVDLAFFTLVTCLVLVAGKIVPRLVVFPILIFLLLFLSAYDWLTLTGRGEAGGKRAGKLPGYPPPALALRTLW